MPTGLPCPNPTCTHAFPPDAVKGVAALKCPRCGTVFQFRSGPEPAKPAPPARPAAKPLVPAPAPPIALAVSPVPLAVPVAQPVADPAAAVLAPPPDFVAPRLKRKPKPKAGRWRWALLLGAGGLLLAVVLTAGWAVRSSLSSWLHEAATPDVTTNEAHVSKVLNYQFRLPARNWELDKDTKLALRCAVGMRRTDPNSWLAILAKDFKDRTPQDAEMIDEGVARLKDYFKDRFEWEQRDDVQLGGKRAQRIVFLAESVRVEMVGECYLLAHNGVGYWFVTWGPEAYRDAVVDEWPEVRKGFALLKERDGWAEKPPRQLTLTGAKVPYTLGFTEGIWEKQGEPEGYDGRADAALLGRDAMEPKHADKTATAVVLVLAKQDDLKAATAAALGYFEAQQKKVYPETKVTEIAEPNRPPDRQPDEIGNGRGRLLKLDVKNAEGRQRLVYLAVVPQPDQLLVVECECDWRRRTYWEVNFAQLLRKLKVK